MSKKLTYFISFVLVLGIAAASPAGLDDDPNLAGWWKFDGDTSDSSGNGRNGMLVADAYLADIGMLGGALELDGTDDYVTIPGYKGINADRTDPDNPFQKPFSVACWVKTTGNGSLVNWGSSDGTGVGGQYQNLRIDGGRLRAEHGNGRFRGAAIVNDGEWHHVAMTVAQGANLEPPGTQLYVDGQKDTQGADTVNAQNIWNLTEDADVGIGVRASHVDRFLAGLFDDVRIYDRELDAGEVALLAKRPKSYDPDPANGALIEEVFVLLQWTPGGFAVEHDVYFGTNPSPGPAELMVRQAAASYLATPLLPGQTYYWRIDDVKDDGTVVTGDTWSFSTPPRGAYNPSPPDGMINAATDVTLSWAASWNPAMYRVHFGTDADAIANAVAAPLQTTVGFDPGPLQPKTTYYWRVDVVYTMGLEKGPVWSFSTMPDIPLADDPNLVAHWSLDEAAGTVVLDMSGHGHHGTFVSAPQWVDGLAGSALEFDGADDEVEHLLPEARNFPTFTTALWVRAATVGQVQYSSAFSSHTPNTAGHQIDVDGGNPGVYRLNPPGGTTLVFGPVVTEWVHLALVGEGTALQFYYNGSLAMTGDVTDSEVLFNQFVLGAARSRANHFAGTIEDFRFYDKALSADEVKQLTRVDPSLAWDPQPATGAVGDIWRMALLSWTPGDGAVEHDVYVGTDRAAVAAADASDATGVYRGRQAETAHVVSDGLAWLTRYYWRVDEVAADGTISKGLIWNFTTTDNIVLYDVETPFPYDNSVAPYLSEISLELDPAQDWTDPIGRLAISYTGQAASGSVTEADGIYTVVGRGADIWGTADQFQFAHTMLTGDGSLIVKVESLTSTDPWTKAGIMIRQTLDPGSPFAAVYATGTNGVRFQARMAADQSATSDTSVATAEQKALNPPIWLLLVRQFPTVNAYYSHDGLNWTPMSWNPQIIPMSPAPIYIGLAVTSHSGADVYAEATFSNVYTSGGVAAGPLTSTEIGLASNSAEPMYLVLENAAGATAVVYNPDPAATQKTGLTDWIINLKDFDIDRTAVTKATLGLGNLENPTPGGSGLLTISNVRLLPRLPAVIWVSFHGADDAPSAGAAGVGFTEAPDKGYTDLLKANGYDVTRYITTNNPDPVVLKAADLVIISRSVASSGYQNNGATAWNSIAAPMIIVNGYTIRKNRMGFATGNNIPDITGDITLTVNDPTHPIFAGIPLVDGVMVNPYAGLATYPTDGTQAFGISVVTDAPSANGTVLATLSAASGSVTAGSMVIAEWPAGATVTHDGGAGTDVLGGPRLVFLTGSRENGGKSSEATGMYDLYEDGGKMFLNAVKYMIPVKPADPGTDGLVAYYALDTDANDSSGNGFNGTLFGDPEFVEGPPGYGMAMYFDGDDYVDTGNALDLANWTISAWVKSPAAPEALSPSGPVHREKNFQFNWNHSNATFRGAAALRVGGTWYAAKYEPAEADTWYHLTATYDGEDLKAYRDGVLITTNSTPSGPPDAETGTLKLGRHATSATQYFTGTVDEAVVYSRALSHGEVLYLAGQRAPVDPGTAGLVVHYAFENDAQDSSANALHGTLMGDPVFAAGRLGMALDLDGNGDYVDCGTNAALDGLSAAMTASGWINIRSVTHLWMAVMAKGENAWRISVNNGTLGLHFGFTGSSRDYQAANSASQVALNEWHHVAATYDLQNGAQIYIDGAVDGSNPDLGGVQMNTAHFLIGENPESTGRFFDGLIDEVTVYDRALSSGEILYLAGHRAYTYNGDAAVAGPANDNDSLDGTWDHNNGSDAWDGSAIGEASPGGASALVEDGVTFLRIQDTGDPRDYGMPDPSNRKVYLTHTTGIGLDGVRLEVRARIATSAPLDDQHPDGGAGIAPWPAEGIGYYINFDGKGMFGIAEAGLGIISFSLAQAGEIQGLETDALVMNNLVGATPSGDVDTGAAATAVNTMPVDDATLWNTFVIDIAAGGAGTHIVTVSANGGQAQPFDVTAGTGLESGKGSYITVGSPGTDGNTAFDVDYIAVRTPIPPPEPEEPEEPGGVNVLANGGFEDGVLDPWTTYGNVTAAVVQQLVDAAVPENPIEGNYCLHVAVPAAGANFWDMGLQHRGVAAFEQGKKYTLSVWLKCKSGTLTVNLKPEVDGSPWTGYGEKQVTMTDTWAEYTLTTPIFDADVVPACLTFHIGFAAAEFWVDDARWYEGDYVAP